MWKLLFFTEFEAFGCSLDTGGGADREVCSGKMGGTAGRGELRSARARGDSSLTSYESKSKPLLTRKFTPRKLAYVVMLISVTKAIMYLCRDDGAAQTNQVGWTASGLSGSR